MFKSREIILERYFWLGLRKDVQEHVQACRECARVKPWYKPARVRMKPILLAAAPNHRIHVDLYVPLKVTEGGKKYVCVITDSFTKYVELSAILDKKRRIIHTSNEGNCTQITKQCKREGCKCGIYRGTVDEPNPKPG